MNIQHLLQNDKTNDILTKNSEKLYKACLSLKNSKTTQYVVAKNGMIAQDLYDISKKIKKCSKHILTATNLKKSPMSKIVSIQQCGKAKLCPICANKSAGKKLKKLRESLPMQKKEDVQYCYMLTATVKNGSDCNERTEHLRDSWRAFYKLGKSEDGRNRNGELSKITGYMKSLEIDIDKNGEYHPHYHIIIFCKDKIDYTVYNSQIKQQILSENPKITTEELKKELSKRGGVYHEVDIDGKKTALSKISMEWYRITGDSYNIHLSPIWLPSTMPDDLAQCFSKIEDIETMTEAEKKEAKKQKNIIAPVRYSLKYAIKPATLEAMTPVQLLTVLDCFTKFRTTEISGFLRKEKTARKKDFEDKKEDIEATEKQDAKELKSLQFLAFCMDAKFTEIQYTGQNGAEIVDDVLYIHNDTCQMQDVTETKTAYMYRVGADIQASFIEKNILASKELRKMRKKALEEYNNFSKTAEEYIFDVAKIKKALSMLVYRNGLERDFEINYRTGGGFEKLYNFRQSASFYKKTFLDCYNESAGAVGKKIKDIDDIKTEIIEQEAKVWEPMRARCEKLIKEKSV